MLIARFRSEGAEGSAVKGTMPAPHWLAPVTQRMTVRAVAKIRENKRFMVHLELAGALKEG